MTTPETRAIEAAESARWSELDRHFVRDLSDARVLAVGPEAESDAEALAARGARETVVLGGSDQAPARPCWGQLGGPSRGRFDLVLFDAVLHTEPDPPAALKQLRELLADQGELWLGAFVLARIELSEYARFVPDRYAGDPSWRWVPGRLTLRWLLDAAGLAVTGSFDLDDQPEGEFPVLHTFVRARVEPGVAGASQPAG
jgi:SAM-dependent methyltransferase